MDRTDAGFPGAARWPRCVGGKEFGLAKLTLSFQLGTELQPIYSVHAEHTNGDTANRCEADNCHISHFKVCLPSVPARVKEADDIPHLWIDACEIRTLMQITVVTC